MSRAIRVLQGAVAGVAGVGIAPGEIKDVQRARIWRSPGVRDLAQGVCFRDAGGALIRAVVIACPAATTNWAEIRNRLDGVIGAARDTGVDSSANIGWPKEGLGLGHCVS